MAKTDRSLWNPVPMAESRLAEPQWFHQNMKLDCFTVQGGTLSACIRISICMEPCGMWITNCRWSYQIHIKRRKWIRDAKFGETGFYLKMKLKIKVNQPQINRGLNSAKMHVWSKFGNPDFNWWLLIEPTSSQAQNKVNWDFKLNLTSKVMVDCPPKQGPSPSCCAPLCQILWSYLERAPSYCADKQVIDAQTETHRHRQRQYPEAKTGLG